MMTSGRREVDDVGSRLSEMVNKVVERMFNLDSMFFGEYPPGWDRRANEIKFEGKGCCHRCGAKEDHVCERVNVMLYYYVIFASKTFSK